MISEVFVFRRIVGHHTQCEVLPENWRRTFRKQLNNEHSHRKLRWRFAFSEPTSAQQTANYKKLGAAVCAPHGAWGWFLFHILYSNKMIYIYIYIYIYTSKDMYILLNTSTTKRQYLEVPASFCCYRVGETPLEKSMIYLYICIFKTLVLKQQFIMFLVSNSRTWFFPLSSCCRRFHGRWGRRLSRSESFRAHGPSCGGRRHHGPAAGALNAESQNRKNIRECQNSIRHWNHSPELKMNVYKHMNI